MADRCVCGCGRFVESPGDFATDWCSENHAIKRSELAEFISYIKNPEEPDIVY